MPVAVLHGSHSYAPAAGGGNEISISQVQSGMGYSLLIGLEKDQISRFQGIHGNLPAGQVLFVCPAGKDNALSVKHILDKSGAVKA